MAGQPVSGRKGLFLGDDIDPVGVLLERVCVQLAGYIHSQKQDKRHRETESQQVDRAVKFVALQEVNETAHKSIKSIHGLAEANFLFFILLLPYPHSRFMQEDIQAYS